MAVWAASAVAPRARTDPGAADGLRRQLAEDLADVDVAAREWTGLGSDLPHAEFRVVGRIGWVRANLAALRGVFEPLRDRLEDRPAAAQVLGAQLGALLGALSGKVLGQYVLPLGDPAATHRDEPQASAHGTSAVTRPPGTLVVVGPNVLDLAERHGPLADDLRRAVLLHEVTHLLQFGDAGWLAHHMRGLLDRYLADIQVDRGALKRVASRLPDLVSRVRRDGSIEPVLDVVMTDTQREVLADAQAMMSLLEGHANAAMFDAGVVDDPEEVRAALASRTADVVSKVLSAVAGLETKRRQYRDGETFVREIIERAGRDTLNLAFATPASLPRPDDFADPAAWVDRVRAA